MENTRILVDTSIIIDFLRKKNKQKAYLWNLMNSYTCYMSSVSVFELYAGAKNELHFSDLEKILKWIKPIDFNFNCAEISSDIYKDLKALNQIIEFRDIFIASTAIANNISLATLNLNHFQRIRGLDLLKI